MQIQLRYCSAWNYEPQAVSLTAKILAQYKQQIATFQLEPSSGGCFELTIDGDIVYSKLKTGEFPDENQMIAEVAKRL